MVFRLAEQIDRTLSILRSDFYLISFTTSDNLRAKFDSNMCVYFRIFCVYIQKKWTKELDDFVLNFVLHQHRVARIFGTKKTGSTSLTCPRAKYISPRSQLAITGALTLIEVFVNASWLIYQPPRTTHIFPDRWDFNSLKTLSSFHMDIDRLIIFAFLLARRYKRVLICEGMDHYTYLVGLVYPLILIGCCTVYAFQTRKCPGGFNEARYIGFTTYTTCVLWMAFIPLFLTAPTTTLRIVTLAMSMSIR